MESSPPYRTILIFFLAAMCTICALVAGCSRSDSYGGDVEGPVETVAAALERSARGRTIVVQGRIHDVCRDEGCWFVLSDSSREITVRYVDETGLGIPVISGGSMARVKGRIRDTVIGRNRVPELRASGLVLLKE